MQKAKCNDESEPNNKIMIKLIELWHYDTSNQIDFASETCLSEKKATNNNDCEHAWLKTPNKCILSFEFELVGITNKQGSPCKSSAPPTWAHQKHGWTNMSVILILNRKHHDRETLNLNKSEFGFDRSFAPPSDVFASLQWRITHSLVSF